MKLLVMREGKILRDELMRTKRFNNFPLFTAHKKVIWKYLPILVSSTPPEPFKIWQVEYYLELFTRREKLLEIDSRSLQFIPSTRVNHRINVVVSIDTLLNNMTIEIQVDSNLSSYHTNFTYKKVGDKWKYYENLDR